MKKKPQLYPITSCNLVNFGPIRNLEWENLSSINLIIGGNGSGKTFLLKSLYTAMKVVEQFQRGREIKTLNELLYDKLYWTFQPDKIGDIVTKGEKELFFNMKSSFGELFHYAYGNSTTKRIGVQSTYQPRSANSMFIPAKEIISLQSVIKQSRDYTNSFGFDDTYYDLATALTPTTKGKNYKTFADSRTRLSNAIGGRIFYDEAKKSWVFFDANNKQIDIFLASEGIKKMSVLDTLLGNHYLSSKSVIFIDEPESALHPSLVGEFMEIIFSLSQLGIQFFIASHSYFVIKKLYILAQKYNLSIPVLSFLKDDYYMTADMLKGMPENPIVNEAINLYEEEIDL